MEIGSTYLITTDNWFLAPDGQQYRAVFGTVHGIHNDEGTLGIETNDRSTNWYLEIGNMTIAGCQIHYVLRTDNVDFEALPISHVEHGGRVIAQLLPKSHIYNADGDE